MKEIIGKMEAKVKDSEREKKEYTEKQKKLQDDLTYVMDAALNIVNGVLRAAQKKTYDVIVEKRDAINEFGIHLNSLTQQLTRFAGYRFSSNGAIDDEIIFEVNVLRERFMKI